MAKTIAAAIEKGAARGDIANDFKILGPEISTFPVIFSYATLRSLRGFSSPVVQAYMADVQRGIFGN